jgi:hypothetical protein
MPQIDQKREQKKRQQEEERALELAEQRRIDREQAELQRKCAATRDMSSRYGLARGGCWWGTSACAWLRALQV